MFSMEVLEFECLRFVEGKSDTNQVQAGGGEGVAAYRRQR